MIKNEQLNERRKRVGASDFSALIGLNPWSNAYSTWLEKCGMLEPAEENPSISFGNRFECVLLDEAESRWGRMDRQVLVMDAKLPMLGSLLDGKVVADGTPVEVKTCGRNSPLIHGFGEPGTSEIPDAYLLQCQVQLRCTRANLCRVLALVAGDVLEYSVEPSRFWITKIGDIVEDYWRYVETNTDPRATWWDRLKNTHGLRECPDPCQANTGVTARIIRQPGKRVYVDPAKISAWLQARDLRLEAENNEDRLKAAVQADMVDGEFADTGDGREVVFVYRNGASSIDRKTMEADGILQKYLKATRYRAMTVRKIKP
jgi:putative phage-type endonuclease